MKELWVTLGLPKGLDEKWFTYFILSMGRNGDKSKSM